LVNSNGNLYFYSTLILPNLCDAKQQQRSVNSTDTHPIEPIAGFPNAHFERPIDKYVDSKDSQGNVPIVALLGVRIEPQRSMCPHSKGSHWNAPIAALLNAQLIVVVVTAEAALNDQFTLWFIKERIATITQRCGMRGHAVSLDEAEKGGSSSVASTAPSSTV
jgi:hypothetical protein